MDKRILFISGIDFKDKSIQVIKNTPLAYSQKGWGVDYFVYRDTAIKGNYFYEKEINPTGLNVIRKYYSGRGVYDRIGNHFFATIWNKMVYLHTIFLAYKFVKKELLKSNSYDVIYGYEVFGVLVVRLLLVFGHLKKEKTISRFQGTWLTKYIKEKNYKKIYLNFDHIWAMKTQTDLAIMTDDGTQGDVAFQRYNPSLLNFHFLVNGVDKPILKNELVANLKEKYKNNKEVIVVSVSRLEGWKRVDRCVDIVKKAKEIAPEINFKYLVLGEGSDRVNLEKIVEDNDLSAVVNFIGAVKNNEVPNYYSIADVFFSFYDLSNVGNPLLEATRANLPIFTLNNGDTNKWVDNGLNGFIYDTNSDFISSAAKDLIEVVKNKEILKNLTLGQKKREEEQLWTWKDRLDFEVNAVEELIS